MMKRCRNDGKLANCSNLWPTKKIKRLESYQQQAMLVPKAIMHCEMIWKYALDYDKGKQTKQKQRKKSKKKKKTRKFR